MKRALVLLLLLGIAVFATGLTAMASESRGHQLLLQEMDGADPYLLFRDSSATSVCKLVLDEGDANAVAMVFDMHAGSSTYVPGIIIADDSDVDLAFFDGYTQQFLALIDDDADSWITIGFTADDTPEIAVGGAASTLTLPAVISGYTATDDLDWGLGTGTTASIEYTTADANANYVMVMLPAQASNDVPVFGLTQGDTDLGYFTAQAQTLFFVEDTDKDAYVALTFSADDTPVLDAGGAASSIGFIDNVNFGVTGTGVDTTFWGDTATYKVWFDQNGDTNGAWYFGADDLGLDVTWYGLTASNQVLWDASGDEWIFGTTGEGVDVTWWGTTAGDYVLFDDSEDDVTFEDITLEIMDDTILSFGDGADATIQYDENGNDDLQITGTVGFDGSVNFGIDGTGVDTTFFGDTASYKVWFDQNGDTNGTWFFGADDYGLDVEFYGLTADYNVTWDASADSWLFGADNLGVDVFFYGAGTGNYATFDESIDTASFVDYNVKFDDDALIYFGTGTNVTTADGDFTINFSDGSPGYLTITAVTAEDVLQFGDGSIATDVIFQNTTTAGADVFWDDSGELWKFGADDVGVDVGFYGDTAGDFILFDESADELIVEDVKINIMDDTVLAFGDADDITMEYDEDGTDTLLLTGDVSVIGELTCTVPIGYDALLGSVEVDVNAVATTALYTVPTGYSCVITRIVIRSANKSLDQGTDAISNIGFDAATDLVTTATISIVLTGSTTWDLLTLVNPGVMGTTTQVLNWHNTTGSTTADSTLQVDVFGYLF